MNLRYPIIMLVIVVLLVALALYLGNREYGPDVYVSPSGTSTQNTQRNPTIEEYVSRNISSLSPIKEQLGGTFYVTSIEAHGGTGTVNYEDGHSAYIADFTYTVDGTGMPAVTSFKIRS